ncbi:MAG: carboxypeptidase-like regulatory domain-containing protein [Elusimicrobiota bacterium]
MKIKYRVLLALLLISIILIATNQIHAVSVSERLSLGIGYPYVSLKYGAGKETSIELRGAFDSGISIYGGRFYYNFYSKGYVLGFAGVEADCLTFDVDSLQGNGWIIMPFIGGEYFINNNLSFGADIGPAYINVQSKAMNKDFIADGIEIVCNLAINWYFDTNQNKSKTEKIDSSKESEQTQAKDQTDNKAEEMKISIVGTITDVDGHPVSNATIKLIKEDEEIISVNSSEDGKYRMDWIIHGSYNMIVWKKGYKIVRKSMSTGKAITIDIILEENR